MSNALVKLLNLLVCPYVEQALLLQASQIGRGLEVTKASREPRRQEISSNGLLCLNYLKIHPRR